MPAGLGRLVTPGVAALFGHDESGVGGPSPKLTSTVWEREEGAGPTGGGGGEEVSDGPDDGRVILFSSQSSINSYLRQQYSCTLYVPTSTYSIYA